MLSLYILTSVVLGLAIHYVRRFLVWRQKFVQMPGEKSFSLLQGTMHKYPGVHEEGIAAELSRVKQCVYFHRHWYGPVTPLISLYDPEAIKKVVKSSAPKPYYRIISSTYQMLKPFLGDGLIVANGQPWARHRRLLTPAFHFDILRPYVNIYNSCGRVMMNKLREKCAGGEPVDLYPLVNLNALDIILQSAFSYKTDCQTLEKKPDYLVSLQEIERLFTKRFLNPLHFVDFIYNLSADGREFQKHLEVVHSTADDVIEHRRRQLEEIGAEAGKKKVRDFLDTLLLTQDENGQSLTVKEIRDQVDSFMFAGHDTTTSGTTFTLYHLAQHPECQRRVYEEVCEVLGDRDQVEWADLSKLTYTSMCIKEALRHSSTVPSIGRQLSEDLEVNGHTIPKGTEVWLEIYLLHHNPAVWDNPSQYDPERFHPDRQRHMHPFQFIPFSAGARNCIGQNFAMSEMKVSVAHVIKNFKLTPDPKHKLRHYNMGIMVPENGAYVIATPRE